MHIGLRKGHLKKADGLEYLRVEGRIILKRFENKQEYKL
jgi:hypothetical protein